MKKKRVGRKGEGKGKRREREKGKREGKWEVKEKRIGREGEGKDAGIRDGEGGEAKLE